MGTTELLGARLNPNFDLQHFRGAVIANWDRSSKLWKSQNKSQGWILADCLAIRERQNNQAKVVGMIAKNEIVSVIKVEDDWAEVQFSYQQRGWIELKHLSFTSPASTVRFVKR